MLPFTSPHQLPAVTFEVHEYVLSMMHANGVRQMTAMFILVFKLYLLRAKPVSCVYKRMINAHFQDGLRINNSHLGLGALNARTLLTLDG